MARTDKEKSAREGVGVRIQEEREIKRKGARVKEERKEHSRVSSKTREKETR